MDEEKQAWIDFERRRKEYLHVFGSNAGRSVLLDIMQRSYMFSTTYAPDASLMCFREGERNKFLEIVAHVPELVCDVIAEWGREREKELAKNTGESDE